MEPVVPNPLPHAPTTPDGYSIITFLGVMTRTLWDYLEKIARRANGSLPKDGSEPMEGDLDLGGNDIVNVANLFNRTKVTTFTASGTFTPDADMLECVAEAWGGGGGGGGSAVTGPAQASGGSGGNGGGYARSALTAAQIGASQTVTIGAGGAGGVGGVAGGNGAAGGVTTLGALLSAKGGEGAVGAAAAGSINLIPATPTQSATGDIRGWTSRGSAGVHTPGTVLVVERSGQTDLGAGMTTSVQVNGVAANANTGAGGGGTTNGASQGAARTGGTGGSGFLIITEYLKP